MSSAKDLEDKAKRLASFYFPAQVQAQVGHKRRREKGDSWEPNLKIPGTGYVLHSRDPERQHASANRHTSTRSEPTREVIDLSSSPDLPMQVAASGRTELAPRANGATVIASTTSTLSLHALGPDPSPRYVEEEFGGIEYLLEEEERWEESQRTAQLPRNALSAEAMERARRDRDEIKENDDEKEGEAKWQINYPSSYRPNPKQKPTAWEIQKTKLDLEKAKARAQYEAKMGAATGSGAHRMPAPALTARFMEYGQDNGLATEAEYMDLNFDLYADKGRRKPTPEGASSAVSGLSLVERTRLESGQAHGALAGDAVRFALRAKRAQHVQHVLEFSASTICGESDRDRARSVTQALKDTSRNMEEFYRCALGIGTHNQQEPAPRFQTVGSTFRSETHYIETFGPLVLEEMLQSAEADLRGNTSAKSGSGRQRQAFDVRCYKVYADGNPVLSLTDVVDVTSNAARSTPLLQMHVCNASREDLRKDLLRGSDATSSAPSSSGVYDSNSRSAMDRLPQEELCVVLYNSEAITPSSTNLARMAQSSSSFLCVIGRAGIDESEPVLFCLKPDLQRVTRLRGWDANPCGTWHVVPLLSLMTSAREWAALQSIRYEQLMPLGPYLLNAAPVVSAMALSAVRDRMTNKLNALKRVWNCLAEENEDEHHRSSTVCNKLILRCSQVVNSILLDLGKLREMSVDSSVLVKTGIVKTLKQDLQKSEVLREYLEEAEICEKDGDRDAAVAARKVVSCCKEILKQWAADVKFAENERIKALKGLPAKPKTLTSETGLRLDSDGLEVILPAHTVKRPIRLSEALWSALCRRFNASQLAAVRYICDTVGKPTDMRVALLQGPPGTGKTTTVIGMISVLLVQSAVYKTLGENEGSKKPRVLLCTPSNTACDELLLRLMKPGAVLNMAGGPMSVSIVRLGRSQWEDALQDDTEKIISEPNGCHAERKAVAALSLEFQTDDRLKKTAEYAARVACLEELSVLQRSAVSGDAEVAESITRVRRALANAEQHLGRLRFHIRADILRDSDVVAGTLSSAGQSHFVNFMVTHDIKFDTCIIDEAAQTSEPSSLIPLQYGCKCLVLVGDPKQLPATIHSTAAKSAGLDRSLFERLQSQGHDKFMLTIQYRMHPCIRAFPSQRFYDGLLTDAQCIQDEVSAGATKSGAADTSRCCIFGKLDYLELQASRPGLPGFTSPKSIRIDAVNFFDIRSHEASRGKSFQNEPEALFCSYLAFELSKQLSGRSIAILTPYSGQRALLERCIGLLGGDTTLTSIEVNTVDGFQGREADAVIFSCVRSGQDGIGFLSDQRRLNVAITRARGCLIIVGNSGLVCGRSADDWKALHRSLAEQGRVTSVTTAAWNM